MKVSYPDQDKGVKTMIHDISIDIRDDEFIGLLGSSGAGKTQLSYALARFNTYRGGIISCDEQSFEQNGKKLDLLDSTQLQKFRSESISYIFQEAFGYFNPVLKLKNQLVGIEKLQPDQLHQFFHSSGLEDFDRILGSYPFQLSGGQLQRLAILQCILRDPMIIVADEIDSALDDTNAKKMMQLILDLKKLKKFSLIWITHDQSKAKEICDRIWYMDKGELIFDGNVSSFKSVKLNFPANSILPTDLEYLRLDGISKNFNIKGQSYPVLRNISLKINSSEIVGMVGASGSGKSTLAKIIAGIDIADSGHIFINNKLLRKDRSPDKNIIYLFQDAYSSLNPQWTVTEILNEAIRVGENRTTLTALLSLGEFQPEVAFLKSSQLSGGMRQRVAILRALAISPKLLILDESLNAMDHELQIRVLKILFEQIKISRGSLMIISHQVDLVKTIAHRIYKLEFGTISLQKF